MYKPKFTVHKIYISYIAKCCFLNISSSYFLRSANFEAFVAQSGNKAEKRVENGESRVGVPEVFERTEVLTHFRWCEAKASCIWRRLWLNVWHLARNLQLQSFQFWILTYGQSQSCNISSWLSLRKRPTGSMLGGLIKILWTCPIISHLRGGTCCRLARQPEERLQALSKLSAKLGLRCPSEATYGAIVFMGWFLFRPEQTEKEKLKFLEEYKPKIKRWISGLPASGPYVVELPQDPIPGIILVGWPPRFQKAASRTQSLAWRWRTLCMQFSNYVWAGAKVARPTLGILCGRIRMGIGHGIGHDSSSGRWWFRCLLQGSIHGVMKRATEDTEEHPSDARDTVLRKGCA